MKKRTSQRSLILYTTLLMHRFKKVEINNCYAHTYYGVELTPYINVYIHIQKAKFSVERNGIEWFKANGHFIINTTKITKKSFDIIIGIVNEKTN